METLKRKHEEGVEISGGVSRAFVADSRLLGGFFWVGGRRGEERREACLFFLLFFFSFHAMRSKELIGKSRSYKERGLQVESRIFFFNRFKNCG